MLQENNIFILYKLPNGNTKVTKAVLFPNRKKAVRAAVIAKWPGNELPNFKKQPAQQEVLKQLVEELEEECTYLTVGFDKRAIRQHILDILNERRRHVRNGHDYTKV